MSTETATLGGGCFWCLEAVFAEVAGVTSVVSGYAGGQTDRQCIKSIAFQQLGSLQLAQMSFPGR